MKPKVNGQNDSISGYVLWCRGSKCEQILDHPSIISLDIRNLSVTNKCVVAVMISSCAFNAFLSLLTLWLHNRYVDFVSTEVICLICVVL